MCALLVFALLPGSAHATAAADAKVGKGLFGAFRAREEFKRLKSWIVADVRRAGESDDPSYRSDNLQSASKRLELLKNLQPQSMRERMMLDRASKLLQRGLNRPLRTRSTSVDRRRDDGGAGILAGTIRSGGDPSAIARGAAFGPFSR
jgi:hypothetical protein